MASIAISRRISSKILKPSFSSCIQSQFQADNTKVESFAQYSTSSFAHEIKPQIPNFNFPRFTSIPSNPTSILGVQALKQPNPTYFNPNFPKSCLSYTSIAAEKPLTGAARPLSPHLSIYKPQLNSTLSISNRVSAIVLTTVALVFYIVYMKAGLICFTFENFHQFLFYGSKLIPVAIGVSGLAFSYHLLYGIRHLLLH